MRTTFRVCPAVATVIVTLSLQFTPFASSPAQSQSLRDQLDAIQDSLEVLEAEAALRRADQMLAICETRLAAGATTCDLPRFCAEAISSAAPGTTIDCRGYKFTKPASQPRPQWSPAPGAHFFKACALANCTEDEKRCAASRGMDPTSCRAAEAAER